MQQIRNLTSHCKLWAKYFRFYYQYVYFSPLTTPQYPFYSYFFFQTRQDFLAHSKIWHSLASSKQRGKIKRFEISPWNIIDKAVSDSFKNLLWIFLHMKLIFFKGHSRCLSICFDRKCIITTVTSWVMYRCTTKFCR